ncbi:Uma2 family endonuclease [Ectothiorhodospiraceae bacterium BW-2]|nr:Uma2 family endonuclease [Ectothiorhodospiraceae bacterium BW-2]
MRGLALELIVERYRLEDYRHWQGDWELIDGIPLAMAPSPGFRHQRVAMNIAFQLRRLLDSCPHCQVLYEIDVEFSEDTVVRPDLIVICHTPEGERITRAPELIVEILSKTTANRDESTKLQLYEREGVSYYAIVAPEAKRTKLYRLIDGEYRKIGDFYAESQPIELSKCAFTFDFSSVWQ